MSSFHLSSERLDKAIVATHRRNAERAPTDLSCFDERALGSEKVRAAVVFFLENLYAIEAAGAANLAQLARHTPVGSLRAAYGAQMSDEVAHATLLRRYLVECLGVRELREHPGSVAARTLGIWVQRHPLLGVECITLPIEIYAAHLLEEFAQHVDEPALTAMLLHIQKDEARHKVMNTEAVVLLERSGMGSSGFMQARRKATRAATTWFTKRVLNGLLRRHCGALGISWNELYDRSMDEIDAALAQQRALALDSPHGETS